MWRKLHGKILPSDRGKREAYITADWSAILIYASLKPLARGCYVKRARDISMTQTLGKELSLRRLPFGGGNVRGRRKKRVVASSPRIPVCQ
jgi:hypothetical protein